MRKQNSRLYILIGGYLLCGVRELAFVLDCDYIRARDMLRYKRLVNVHSWQDDVPQDILAIAFHQYAPGVVYDREESKYYVNPTIASEKLGIHNSTVHKSDRFRINNVQHIDNAKDARIEYLEMIKRDILSNAYVTEGSLK